MADTVKLDWHGHNDRGLALSCALAAIDEGVDQVHGCALGIGERTGNTPIELLLVNLKMFGLWKHDLHKLPNLSVIYQGHLLDIPQYFLHPVISCPHHSL